MAENPQTAARGDGTGIAADFLPPVPDDRQLFDHLADTAPVMIWIADTNKNCFWFNKLWLDFTGRSMEEEQGTGWTRRVHPDDLGACLKIFSESFERRLPFDMEYRLKRNDGEYRWLVDHGVPRYATGGDFLGYVGSCIDITRRKMAEDELEQAGHRKNQFIATLAHELRNPLAPIRTGLDILKHPELSVEKRQSVIGVMERHMSHLVLLLDDLLEVSRITQGEMKIRRESVDLRDCLAHVIDSCQEAVRADGRKFSFSMPDEAVWIEGDPVRLEQVFLNLITNAIKFTPANADIRVHMTPGESEVKIVFGDGGIGIAREEIPRLFEIFNQGGRTCNGGAAGLGIGLSVVKSLVERHGGSVVARSDGEGKGSEFTVRLPLAVPPGDTGGAAGS